MTDASEIKKRAAIEKPLAEVKQEQMTFFSDKMDQWLVGDRIIRKDKYDEVIFAIMNVPELMAHNRHFRGVCVERGNQIKTKMENDPEKTDMLKLWKDFLKILEDRDDYILDPPPLIVISG